MNEPSSHEDDLLDEAVAAVRQMPTPERPLDSVVLESLRHGELPGPTSLPNTLFEKVLRMHPFVRYGIVALVGSVLLLIGFGTHSNALLLADVMKAVAKHKTVKFETKNESPAGLSGGFQAEPGPARQRPPMTRTNFATLDRMHVRTENPGGSVTILDLGKGVFLTLFPEEKRAVVSKFPGKRSALGLLEMIEQLENNKQTIASQEQLDGVDVVVYRLTKDAVKSTIWADRGTMLPLRAEMEMLKGPRQKTTMTGFVWDPPIPDPETFFSVEPPAGYEVTTRNLSRSAGEK
jgi:outer membrane lipoprotein-sorting protein